MSCSSPIVTHKYDVDVFYMRSLGPLQIYKELYCVDYSAYVLVWILKEPSNQRVLERLFIRGEELVVHGLLNSKYLKRIDRRFPLGGISTWQKCVIPLYIDESTKSKVLSRCSVTLNTSLPKARTFRWLTYTGRGSGRL